MKFTAAFLLALPAMALAKHAHSSSAIPTPSSSAIPHPSSTPVPSSTPTPSPDAISVCKSQAGPYTQYCAQCLSQCSSRTGEAQEQCYYSVFMTINYIESECEAMNGYNCAGQAVDNVCKA
ncbi:hypothetical protein PISL3812_07672 [Talaromyces islandicus]|uniref:Extracellular membrane protein CFEM domain-containing protein n=1 Tax=Talaromyces islandicus TaxID=28573 RepID=A0A0U1M4U1_TALIS|nr:hypothetical protein PISL3812_07672 [Talaromyces islandicus]